LLWRRCGEEAWVVVHVEVQAQREERVRRIVGPMLAGDLPAADVLEDDFAYVVGLGLVVRRDGRWEVANGSSRLRTMWLPSCEPSSPGFRMTCRILVLSQSTG